MADKKRLFPSGLDGALEQVVSCSLKGCELRWK